MRVAIVNDMLLAREALRRLIADMAGCSLAWMATDGADAVRKCKEDTPDLILMDLVMPNMDGVQATKLIMSKSPCSIVVVTATVEGNASQVFDALGAGAVDAVQTPVLSTNGELTGALKLRNKIHTIRRLLSAGMQRRTSGSKNPPTILEGKRMVAIGASAGGPAAIATILQELPADFPVPIVIVQHIDGQFAPSMANWLNDQSALSVRIAMEEEPPRPGTALLAAGYDHLILRASQTLGYSKDPVDCHYRPSIDVFFESIADHWKGSVVAVLLTGMGRDGARGLKTLQLAGASTIAQDAASCIVYGMPKAAVELGAVDQILPLQQIASHLKKIVQVSGVAYEYR